MLPYIGVHRKYTTNRPIQNVYHKLSSAKGVPLTDFRARCITNGPLSMDTQAYVVRGRGSLHAVNPDISGAVLDTFQGKHDMQKHAMGMLVGCCLLYWLVEFVVDTLAGFCLGR